MADGPFQSVNCRSRKASWGGMLTPTDPVFAGYSVSPKRISGMLVVSQLLLWQQTEPELNKSLARLLINDLSRQLASYLDQCGLYGDRQPHL